MTRADAPHAGDYSTQASWLRYACSASLVSLLGGDEAAALSGKLASEWPDFWSPGFNAPVELEQLIAANPGAWNRRVHELGAEHLRALTLQGLPIGHVARAPLLHLPRADQLGLAQLLFSSMKHSYHPWLNPGSHRPADAYRPGEAVLELRGEPPLLHVLACHLAVPPCPGRCQPEGTVLRHLFHQLPHLGIRRPHPPIRTSEVTGFLPAAAVTQDGEV